MQPLVFTQNDRDQIGHDRFMHPCPQIQKRMDILNLAANGLQYEQIAKIAGCSTSTVQRRLDDFRTGGLEAVRQRDYKGQTSELMGHAKTLEDHFRNHPPATLLEAQATIESITGIKRGLTQVRIFLNTLRIATPKKRRCSSSKQSRSPRDVPYRNA